MNIHIIIASTREGRTTPHLAKWVQQVAANSNSEVEFELVDLADYELPFFNEAVSPQYNPERAPTGAVKDFLEKIAEADGYIIVTPEYNRSISAVLKNALDYLDFQMAKKPVAIVAHGSTGGAQAVAHLRGILAGALAVSVPQATMIVGRVGTMFDQQGTPQTDVSSTERGLAGTLSDLLFYTGALKATRV